ncbi:segregation/condensation protein A [Streptomyces sp. NPDC005925]|uniref:segregation and condensation protein A n=1 Tax=Streptomyces sp. NPDC005925 TaxID=3157172 RepID=UPI0033D4AEC6
MTPNDVPAPGSGVPAGRRRALGRGPGVPPAEPGTAGTAAPEVPGPEPEAPAAPEPPEPEPAGPGAPGAEPAPAAPQVPEPAAPETPGAEPAAPEVPGAEPAPVASLPEPAAPVAGPAPAGPAVPAVREQLAAPPGEPARVDGDDDGDTGAPPSARPSPGDAAGFKVRLANFEGPFDLLLQLIAKHKLDVTEVALSRVTDEFMAYIRALGPDWDLDETTEFLVVAATLLDLKAARLLPAAEVEDEADLALLEARDLLFARLLQYRAYKRVADIFSGRLEAEARRYPRTVGLEPHHAELLPEVVISIGPEGFARLAVKAMQPKPKPQVYVDHIHAPLVSVQEQAGIVVARLKELGEASFRALVEDTDDTLTVVARFLALLELYREKAVALDQETALGDLLVRWTGGDGDETPTVTDEFDRPPEPVKEDKA